VAQPLGNFLRRCVIVSHRYLGIAISLLVVMWFASGIMMIYVGGMPAITPQQRLDHLSALDISRIQLSPSAAAERANLGTEWSGVGDGRVTLLSVMNRPAYCFGEDATVFADSGEVMQELSPEQSKAVAGRFLGLPEDKLQTVGALTRVDQWTLGMGGQMPLHKVAADDGLGTEVYVQPRTGEVAMFTTRRSRALAWVSAIPHWLYFTALRDKQSAWYQVIVWTSSLACVLAVLGLILAVAQFKRIKPLRLASAIPYAGWMRWHYITGAIFGLFTLTWAFSGLLSMEPFAWTRAEGLELSSDAFTGGPVDLAQFANIQGEHMVLPGGIPASRGLQAGCRQAIKEVEFVRVLGDPYYLVRCGAIVAFGGGLAGVKPVFGLQESRLVSTNDFRVWREPFSVDSLMARLRLVVPNVPVIERQLLTEYDSYYYSRGRQAPLPVLRVKFGDPAQTWFYIDPQMSRVVAELWALPFVLPQAAKLPAIGE
jgi:PepSY-associated TM region